MTTDSVYKTAREILPCIISRYNTDDSMATLAEEVINDAFAVAIDFERARFKLHSKPQEFLEELGESTCGDKSYYL